MNFVNGTAAGYRCEKYEWTNACGSCSSSSAHATLADRTGVVSWVKFMNERATPLGAGGRRGLHCEACLQSVNGSACKKKPESRKSVRRRPSAEPAQCDKLNTLLVGQPAGRPAWRRWGRRAGVQCATADSRRPRRPRRTRAPYVKAGCGLSVHAVTRHTLYI